MSSQTKAEKNIEVARNKLDAMGIHAPVNATLIELNSLIDRGESNPKKPGKEKKKKLTPEQRQQKEISSMSEPQRLKAVKKITESVKKAKEAKDQAEKELSDGSRYLGMLAKKKGYASLADCHKQFVRSQKPVEESEEDTEGEEKDTDGKEKE